MQQNAPAAGPEPQQPLVFVAQAQGGLRVMAANAAAARAGVLVDQLLADARALCPLLRVVDYDPAGDEAELRRLGLWCIRYSPWVATDPPDGILIDITGCAHLLGGEEALARDLLDRLAAFGVTARLAIARSIGAAWALSRFGARDCTVVPDGETASALAPLPLAGLRIDDDTVDRLGQVGLKHIGDLLGKPRAPLAARFGIRLIERLDQALDERPEPLSPLLPPPDYRTSQHLLEPIALLEQVKACLAALAKPLLRLLVEDGKGARCFTLSLYRVDGAVQAVTVRTSTLCHQAGHLERLYREKLDRLEFDAGFGFEQLTLSAYETEALHYSQQSLDGQDEGEEVVATLIDRFGNRLGFAALRRFEPRESHIPERAAAVVPLGNLDGPAHPNLWSDHLRALQQGCYLGRPITLLPRPEEIEAVAEVPDGPPLRFVWRRVRYRVVRAEGPERIAPEWWGRRREEAGLTRDYFRVEDAEGYRFWLFRLGLYERREQPRWFLHGIFA